jgi:hypothetical protein
MTDGALIAMALLSASFHPVPGTHDVAGRVHFSARIAPSNQLAVESHDLGGGVISYVAEYHELHQENARHETVETIAYLGDSIDIQTAEVLAVRRYRRDRWPDEIQYARK